MSLLVQPWSPIHKKKSTKKFFKTIKNIFPEKNYKKSYKKKGERTTLTQNIHKSSLTKNNRWRVILGNLTLITDTINVKTFITTSKNMFWASGFLWPLSRRPLDATMTVTQNTQCHQMSLFNPDQPHMWLIRVKKWHLVTLSVLSYCHSCIQWATRKRPQETWGSKHVFWRSYEGFNIYCIGDQG